jgi:hypothetical protein
MAIVQGEHRQIDFPAQIESTPTAAVEFPFQRPLCERPITIDRQGGMGDAATSGLAGGIL